MTPVALVAKFVLLAFAIRAVSAVLVAPSVPAPAVPTISVALALLAALLSDACIVSRKAESILKRVGIAGFLVPYGSARCFDGVPMVLLRAYLLVCLQRYACESHPCDFSLLIHAIG